VAAPAEAPSRVEEAGSEPSREAEVVWQALADPTRRWVLELLSERPRTTGALCGASELSRFAIMKHLKVLAAAGLVLVERRGRERWNRLDARPLWRTVAPLLRRCRQPATTVADGLEDAGSSEAGARWTGQPASSGGARSRARIARRHELNLEED
jgi:DNA-binding transcriptional ArsR family regulator